MESKKIFEMLADHMLQGIMTHEQLMNCYLFLGLKGYAKCHEYHYLEETKGLIELTEFYSDTHRGILRNTAVTIPDIIPQSWFDTAIENVDFGLRKKAVIAAFDQWIDWETNTKVLYETAYDSLLSQKDIASAEFLSFYVKDVNEELAYAMNERISKSAMDFDMSVVVDEQDHLIKTFTKKIRKMY